MCDWSKNDAHNVTRMVRFGTCFSTLVSEWNSPTKVIETYNEMMSIFPEFNRIEDHYACLQNADSTSLHRMKDIDRLRECVLDDAAPPPELDEKTTFDEDTVVLVRHPKYVSKLRSRDMCFANLLHSPSGNMTLVWWTVSEEVGDV